jgi:hypothetical protein
MASALIAVASCGCAPFGGGEQEPPASTPDGSVVDDAGSTLEDAPFDPLADGGLPETCFDLTVGMAGFVPQGVAQHEPGIGVRLQLVPGGTASLLRDFVSPQPISVSQVLVEGIISYEDGAWGTGTGDYLGVLGLHYGGGTSHENSTTTSFAFADKELEVSVWSAPNTWEGTHPLLFGPLPKSAPLRLAIRSTWSEAGTVHTTLGMEVRSVNVTSAQTPERSLTVVVGGRGGGSVPKLQLLVQRVCVSLH